MVPINIMIQKIWYSFSHIPGKLQYQNMSFFVNQKQMQNSFLLLPLKFKFKFAHVIFYENSFVVAASVPELSWPKMLFSNIN